MNIMLGRVAIVASVLMVLNSSYNAHAADYEITTDHIYGHKAGMALTFDVVRPTTGGNGIGLLYMVSRGWVSNYFDLDNAMATSQRRSGRFYSLLERGYTLFMVRHGSAPYFKVPDAVDDVRRAVRFIRHHADDFEIDGERLGVFGNSAGGHLALMLGVTGNDSDPQKGDPIEQTSASVAAVVVYYPPTDLRRTVVDPDTAIKALKGPLDFDDDLRDSVSPIVHVSKDDPPTLLIHGDKDNSVPLRHSEAMHAELQKAGVKTDLIVFEGAGHAFPGEYGSRAAAALASWFDQHLAKYGR